jgi:hypothetical protein
MLAAVRDQVECLIDRGDVDPAQLKVLLNPAARPFSGPAIPCPRASLGTSREL